MLFNLWVSQFPILQWYTHKSNWGLYSLFIFLHQYNWHSMFRAITVDDEFFCIARINKYRRFGNRILDIFKRPFTNINTFEICVSFHHINYAFHYFREIKNKYSLKKFTWSKKDFTLVLLNGGVNCWIVLTLFGSIFSPY